jgi:hypothetical protein
LLRQPTGYPALATPELIRFARLTTQTRQRHVAIRSRENLMVCRIENGCSSTRTSRRRYDPKTDEAASTFNIS